MQKRSDFRRINIMDSATKADKLLTLHKQSVESITTVATVVIKCVTAVVLCILVIDLLSRFGLIV